MSSTFGSSNGGGDNKDVEADESNRTEDSRATATTAEELDEEDDTLVTAIEELAEDEVPETPWQDEIGDVDDVPQLDRQRIESPDHAVPDLSPGLITPIPRSPLASPGDSGSIPDDTPSLQGSRVSSPGRPASLARRTIARTASGALQPFERRFEARLSASPSPSPRAASPAFLTPHSRQISISSQISQVSSQDGAASDETPQAPWEVVRWTKLRKITGQAFSEIGKRNFGRPTCLAVSALIAIGTSKGLILGFDYHQTLKIIIGQGTKATECGSVTALAISADYAVLASGHENGTIFTWEINKPAKPFLHISPLDQRVLKAHNHPDGHAAGSTVLHVGFLGTRHTALVSADAGGMAFSHLATRGLGPVARTVKTTRLLGRYPPTDSKPDAQRKPSSVLAFSPLPLGNVEQATDAMGLTALLTPYLLVVVSTTPNAQTQHKSPRPKEITPHSTLSGCLAWFPAVKLKSTNKEANKESSDTKLVYCWSNVLTVLDVKVLESDDPADAQKLPSLEFRPRSRWRAEEAIVAVQWLGRSVLGVLTISQRLLILEDGALRITDSVDLLHRHIYHQDLFSMQLQAVVEQLDSEEPSLHGVVADAFFMSFRVYKGRTFLLGFNDLSVGTLSNWADRLMALMEAGDHIAAIRLATDYYAGGANNVTVGLPDDDATRHEMVKERLLAMISASLDYTFSQHDDARSSRLCELAGVCFDACISMSETDYLLADVFERFEEAEEETIFVSTLEPYVLDGDVKIVPPEVVKALVSHFISQGQGSRLEELLCRLDPHSFDLDQMSTLCRQHGLYYALIYVWTQALNDFVTPLVDLLSLVKMLQAGEDDEVVADNPYFDSAMKVFPYLAYSFTSRRYPSGDPMEDEEATHAKADLYEYMFAGRASAWPPGSKKMFHTAAKAQDGPAFPYLTLLLEFDASSVMSMLNEAFEDSFLNEADDDAGVNSKAQSNGIASTTGYKMTRQHIISIMLDVMRQNAFSPEETIYLDMFIARSLPKYPGQLVLSGSLLNNVMHRLCEVPPQDLRDDCQLSMEYLLSAYHPSDVSGLIRLLKEARFFRVLKSVYRGERLFTDLLEAFFEDLDDKEGVFDAITFCIQSCTGSSQRALQPVKQTICAHINDLASISTIRLARTLAMYSPDLLSTAMDTMQDSYQRFMFLRTILESTLLRDEKRAPPLPALAAEEQAACREQYVQLMCAHDPGHVADYVGVLPSGDLRLDQVLPAMEESGVIDAAVVLLARDGLARDAIDRLVTHMQSLQQALTSLIDGAAASPDIASTRESADYIVEQIEKYTKVGIWLCQGQSATVQRRPRPRTNFAWDISEDDLDLDEYLWLNMVDAVVQLSKSVSLAFQYSEDHPSEGATDFLGSDKILTALRSNVQQAFTALLAATSTSSTTQPNAEPVTKPTQDHLSFLRVLRAFLTRAAATAPSLSDLREVLADIFSAYAFEQGVLSLAHDLLDSDVFVEMEEVYKLRQRGWRPRTQVCERCKRRAWGPGIGEVVWDEWVARDQQRDAKKAIKAIERGGGDRRDRGKGKAPSTAVEETSTDPEKRRLALVVFACRHIFHRVCLDEGFRDGKPARRELYKCPICIDAG